MRYPSVKTLMQIKDVTVEEAEHIRRLMQYQLPQTALRKIDEVLRTHGVEYIPSKKDGWNRAEGIDYCNSGDTYAPTVCYDNSTGNYRVSSWGDIVEKNPSRF